MTVLILSKLSESSYENSRLIEKFKEHNIVVRLAHPDKFDIVVGGDIKNGVKYNGEIIDLPEIVLTRTGSGTTKFADALIRQFEEAGVTCINSSESINISKDKLRTSQLLAKSKLPIPNTMLVRFPISHEIVHQEIGWPCVVKVVTGSYGDGVYLCEKRKDFKKLMELIDSLKSQKTLIVQEYVNTRPGEDLRVLVIGGKVIGAMRRIGAEGEFRANITGGGRGEPFEVTNEIDFIARETANVCGLSIAGIDLLFDDDSFKVCEANSAPGFSGFEQYCGIDVAEEIVKYVKFKIL